MVKSLRIVLDTNILVSAFFWEGNESKLLRKCKERHYSLILSLEILDELEKVLKLKFKVPKNKVHDYIKELLLFSEIVFPPRDLDIIKDDPSDNVILETALIGNANILVTGNKHLLKQKKYKKVRIKRATEI